jgi:hypothetical protein
MATVVQLIGSLLILAAFIAAQAGRLEPASTPYIVLNVLGSGVLAVNATTEAQWGFLLLEAVWFSVSLWALVQKWTGREAPSAS